MPLAVFIARHHSAISRVFWLLALVALLLSERVFADRLMGNVLLTIGLMLIGFAIVGRLWCALYIGGRKNDELVSEGPYSMTRNPQYFFSLLGFLGLGLSTRSVSFALSAGLFFAAVYPCVIASEEAFLRNKFGAAFEAYCERTPRFFPSIVLYREPDACEVRPRHFHRTAGDVVWFVWLVGVVALADALGTRLVTPMFVLF